MAPFAASSGRPGATLGRYHALVAINARLAPTDLRHRHGPVLAALEPLIRRGQRGGAFRADVPAAWASVDDARPRARRQRRARRRAPAVGPGAIALVESLLGAVAAVPPR